MRNLIRFKSFIMMAILLISTSGVLYAEKIAIIDAGSSGSRLYVYEISEAHKEISLVYPTTPSEEDQSRGKALSSVVAHQDSVNVFLNDMIRKYNPKEPQKKSLYVLATAGMRLVNEKQADLIYSYIKKNITIGDSYTLKDAMTISGRYEGLYAWIAANYKNGKLGFGISPSETGTPFGILEIGGASMQIAFASDQVINSSDKISRKGFSNIYSKSYLGGGVDQIYSRYKDLPTAGGYQFKEPLDTIHHDGQFWGMGRPIGTVLDRSENKDITTYTNTIKNNDSTDKYHPYMNAHYIKWVFDTMGFLDSNNKIKNISKPQEESSWTLGAALDIVVNGEAPEKFDYRTEN